MKMKLWLYEIHIFELRNEELNVKKILAVINATYAVIHNFIFIFSVNITNQFNDQLPVGLLAQLAVSQRSGFESRQAWFFQAFFSQLHKLR